MSAFTCPNCGKVTGGNQKFCKNCELALNTICPECGEKWQFMFDYNLCPVCSYIMNQKELIKSKA